jgi:hypothetical protein
MVLPYSDGMMTLKTIVIAALALPACMRTSAQIPAPPPVPVCILVPIGIKEEARKGIEWWGVPVTYTCEEPAILVHIGEAPTSELAACAYWDADSSEIVIVCPYDVRRNTAHEFGHYLGLSDTCEGIMQDGHMYADGCNTVGGVW